MLIVNSSLELSFRMASSTTTVKSCSLDACKRDASVLCLHCDKYVCNKHYYEHVKLTNDELVPLSDQLNTLIENLQQMNVTRMSQHAEEQLEQWRQENHRRIDKVYNEKKKLLHKIVQLKLDEERSTSNEIKDSVREAIDQQDASHYQIENFKKSVKAFEVRCTALLRTDFFHVEIKPLEMIYHSLIIKARHSSYFIGGGSLLRLEFQVQLNQWIEPLGQKWRLIYKAIRDGFKGEDFHRCADNQGPTIVIIQSKDDKWLFGGYTSQDWSSIAAYGEDKNRPFIFTLVNPHNIQPTRYTIVPTETLDAIGNSPRHGPTFGGGFDLHVCDESNTTVGSYFKFPVTYADSTGKGSLTFTGSDKFQTSDIEVYRLAWFSFFPRRIHRLTILGSWQCIKHYPIFSGFRFDELELEWRLPNAQSTVANELLILCALIANLKSALNTTLSMSKKPIMNLRLSPMTWTLWSISVNSSILFSVLLNSSSNGVTRIIDASTRSMQRSASSCR